jgi:hypothetical protein
LDENFLYLAKPLVKLNIKECLSLDLLNFVSIDDFPFYMRWENAGVTNLNHIMDRLQCQSQVFLPISKIFEWEDELMSSVK